MRCFRIRRCIFPRSRTDTAFSLLSARTSGAICRCASSVPLSGRSSKRGNVSFTIEEENLICIYHKHARRRTIAAISDALPDMDGDMRPLAEQTIHKLHNMTDAAFEEAQFTMTLSNAE